ncbi:MAG: phage major capsid protein [Candidatus Berkelbacteria bacterium]|nr:phage major capsid protein [Candidatus Berkelbacteria bacterium]
MDEETEVKKGARNSGKNMASLQLAHDALVSAGAECKIPEYEDATMEDKSVDNLISFGGEIKAVKMDNGDVKLGGYLVRFGEANKTDMTGDYFTKDTDFGEADKSEAWFNHRMPVEYKGKRVTYKDQLPDVSLTKDDIGIFAEIVLGARNEYEKQFADWGLAGKLGWSSGTAPHLVDRKQVGNATEITRWKLGLDASLTPTPAEPRNLVIPLKSISVTQVTEAQAEQDKPEAAVVPETIQTNSGVVKMELEETKLQEMLAQAAEAGATKAIAATEPVKSSGSHVQVTEAEEDRPFKSIAENLLAIKADVLTHGNADNQYPRMRFIKANGATEGNPADGGYLLDPTLTNEIIKPMHEMGPFSNYVRRLPVSANSNFGWINGVDETSRATGSRWGGIRGYRIAEAAIKTASKPTFKRINWELKEYAAVVVATDQLLADAPLFSEIVRTGVSEELNFMLNEDIYGGLGLAGPQGFMQSNALVTVTRDAASVISGTDVSAMWHRMDLRGRQSSNWYIGADSAGQLDNLFAVGSTAVLFPYASIGADGIQRLYNRPVIVTEFNAALNTTGDIALADLSQYLLWEKGGVKEETSIHVYFLTDETAYRFTYRVDGKSSVSSALTPFNGSGVTTSPFVVLGTAT